MFKTKSRMDSGIYIGADYSNERATTTQLETSSMQVPTHRMSETMTETCRRRNSLSASRKYSLTDSISYICRSMIVGNAFVKAIVLLNVTCLL